MTPDEYKEQTRAWKLQELKARVHKIEAEAQNAELNLHSNQLAQLDREASLNQAQIFQFFEPVTGGTVEHAIGMLGLWSRRSPGSDITVVLNSPGGGVTAGLALYDFIGELKAKGHQVTTETRGYAASMGGVLLQAGHERVIGPNAYLMIHEVSDLGIGKLSELKDQVEFAERLQERLLDILAERSTMTKQAIRRKWKRKDWWLDAEEAVKHGFADRIG